MVINCLYLSAKKLPKSDPAQQRAGTASHRGRIVDIEKEQQSGGGGGCCSKS